VRRAKSSQYAQNAPSSIKKQIISRFPQHEKARVSGDFETFHGKNGRLQNKYRFVGENHQHSIFLNTLAGFSVPGKSAAITLVIRNDAYESLLGIGSGLGAHAVVQDTPLGNLEKYCNDLVKEQKKKGGV